jgi:hypothetical protein
LENSRGKIFQGKTEFTVVVFSWRAWRKHEKTNMKTPSLRIRTTFEAAISGMKAGMLLFPETLACLDLKKQMPTLFRK